MDFQQLKIFLNLASLKSFSRTAEVLFISQPNVSARIKGLEEELGVSLFDRSRSRELSLTGEGRLFLDYAQSMINLHNEALEKLSINSAPPPAEPVSIGASTVPGIYLLPPLLARFQKAGSGVNISLITLDTAQIIERVLNYSVEIGFVGSVHREERLEYHPFAADELIIIAPPGLLKSSNAAGSQKINDISLEECLSYNLLARERGSATRELFEKTLADQGLGLRDFSSVTFLDSVEAIKQGVRHGLGISLVSRHSAEDYIGFGLVDAYQLSGFNLQRHIYLVRHRGRVMSRAAGLILEFMLSEAKKNLNLLPVKQERADL